ncbi:MAG: hypothetical protein Q9160_009154 [Pyrenula sp. 1 TL-2023]
MPLSPSDFRDLVCFYPATLNEPVRSPAFVYVGVILESLAKETLVESLWTFIAQEYPLEHDQLYIARRLREGLLKASVLVGFPRGINGLAALHRAVSESSPAIRVTLEQDTSLRIHVPKSEREARGKAFFAEVYAQHAPRVLQNLAKISGGDLSEFAVTSVYGDLMAETRILNEKETGLLEFAACLASRAIPQAKGHMFGSRNLGNGKEEIEAVVRIVDRLEEKLGLDVKARSGEEWSFLEKLRDW